MAEIPLSAPGLPDLIANLERVASLMASIKANASSASSALGNVGGGRGGGGAGGGMRDRRIQDLREEAKLIDDLARRELARGSAINAQERKNARERIDLAKSLKALADDAAKDASVDIKNRRKELLGHNRATLTEIKQQEAAYTTLEQKKVQADKQTHALRLKHRQIERNRDIEMYNMRVQETNRLARIQQNRDIEMYRLRVQEEKRIARLTQKRDMEIHLARVSETNRLADIQQRRDTENYRHRVREENRIARLTQRRDMEIYNMKHQKRREEERDKRRMAHDEERRARNIDRIARNASSFRIMGGPGSSAIGGAFGRLGGFMPASMAGTVLRQVVTGGFLGTGLGEMAGGWLGGAGRIGGGLLGKAFGPAGAMIGGGLGSLAGSGAHLAGSLLGVTGGATAGIMFASIKSIENAVFGLGRFAKNLTTSVVGMTRRYGTLGLGAATGLTGAGLVAAGNRQRAEQALSTVAGPAAPGLARVAASQTNRLFSRTGRTEALALGTAFGLTPEMAAEFLPLVENAAAIFGTDVATGLKSIPRAAIQGEAELAEQIGLNLRERAVQQTLGRKVNFENPAERAQAVFQAARIQLQKFRGGAEAISKTIPGGFASVTAGGQDFLSTLGLSFAESFGLSEKQRGVAGFLGGPRGQALAGQVGGFFGDTANRALAFGKNTLLPMAREFISPEQEGSMADQAGTAVFDFVKKLPEYFKQGWEMAKAFFDWLTTNVKSLVAFVTGTDTWKGLSQRLMTEWDTFFEHAKNSDWGAIGKQVMAGAVDAFKGIHNEVVMPAALGAVKATAGAAIEKTGGWGLLGAIAGGALAGGSAGAGIGGAIGGVGGLAAGGVGAIPGAIGGAGIGRGIGMLVGGIGGAAGYYGLSSWAGKAGGGITDHPLVRVGESGAEVVALPVGSRVMPNSEMKRAVRGFADGGVVNWLDQNVAKPMVYDIKKAWTNLAANPGRNPFKYGLTGTLFGGTGLTPEERLRSEDSLKPVDVGSRPRIIPFSSLLGALFPGKGINLQKMQSGRGTEGWASAISSLPSLWKPREFNAGGARADWTPGIAENWQARGGRYGAQGGAGNYRGAGYGGTPTGFGLSHQGTAMDQFLFGTGQAPAGVNLSAAGKELGASGGFGGMIDKARSGLANLLSPGTFSVPQAPPQAQRGPSPTEIMGFVQSFLGGLGGGAISGAGANGASAFGVNPFLIGSSEQGQTGTINNHGNIYINGDRNKRMRSAAVAAA